jgi:hypothetical protein
MCQSLRDLFIGADPESSKAALNKQIASIGANLTFATIYVNTISTLAAIVENCIDLLVQRSHQSFVLFWTQSRYEIRQKNVIEVYRNESLFKCNFQ